MKLIITGASGYIGERLAAMAHGAGDEVYSASRKQTLPHYQWLPFDLRTPTIEIPTDSRALVHLAADTTHNKNISADTEIEAARELIRTTTLADTKLIFISSQTASASAPTPYGQTKWSIEQDVLAAGGVVIRPGQVYGSHERGLFGLLSSLVRRFPLVPILLPAPLIQPIHVDDLCAAILAVACRDEIQGEILCLGSQKPVSFGAFLSAIASEKLNVMRLPVPVPIPLIALASKILGKRRTAQLGLDRLFSLLTLAPMDSQSSLERTGITLRSLAYGMHRSGNGRRRHLLMEARTLLAYVLKTNPSPSLLRRYAKAVEALDGGEAVLNSRLLALCPCAVTLLDSRSFLQHEYCKTLGWRLSTATALAEASPQGANVFLGLDRSESFFRAFIALGMTVLKEASWRALALIMKPLLPRLLPKRNTVRDA